MKTVVFISFYLLPLIEISKNEHLMTTDASFTQGLTNATISAGHIRAGPSPGKCRDHHGLWDSNYTLDYDNTYTMEYVLILSQNVTEQQFSAAKDFVSGMTSLCASTDTQNWMNIRSLNTSIWCNNTKSCKNAMTTVNRLDVIVNISESPDFDNKDSERIVTKWLEKIKILHTQDEKAKRHYAVVLISDFVSMRLVNTRNLMNSLNVSFYAFIVGRECTELDFYETIGDAHLHTPENFSDIGPHAELPCLAKILATSQTPENTTDFVHDNGQVFQIILIIVIPFFLLIFIICMLIFWCLLRKIRRKQRLQHICLEQNWNDSSRVQTLSVYSTHLEAQLKDALTMSNDLWEISRNTLVIDYSGKLGFGAFGTVYRGKLLGISPVHKIYGSIVASELMENCNVAVKVLHEYVDTVTKREFLLEINFMKQLGYHTHLVNMVACVTIGHPCLITEICSNGDLLKFAKKRALDVSNLELTIKEFVSFAWQIADGMIYLSSRNFIHRDLAARNILIDINLIAKIGDFGLCRHADDCVYISKGGRLPIKWMALESLEEKQFSAKSDIWSFGIVLYEMFSFGQVPYPAINPSQIISYLRAGNRLERPPHCAEEIYKIMYKCWYEKPNERPEFEMIKEWFSNLLANRQSGQYDYIDVIKSLSFTP